MKILAVIEDWPDRGGGLTATELWLDLLCGMIEIDVLGPKPFGKCRHIYAPLPHSRPHLWQRLATMRLERIAEKYDAVYIPRYSYPAVEAAVKASVKAAVHLHGYPTYLSTGEKHDWRYEPTLAKKIAGAAAAPLIEALIRRWLKKADVILCVSKSHCANLPYQAKLVPNPPPKTPEINPPRGRYFVYPWGKRPFKGRDLAVATAKALGIPLVETGNLDKDTYYKTVAGAAALLAPAQWEEPYGYAVVEAMLLGTPPVVTRRGALPELVSGTQAEAFVAETPAEFIKAAAQALKFTQWGRLKREAVEKFRPDPEAFLKALQ